MVPGIFSPIWKRRIRASGLFIFFCLIKELNGKHLPIWNQPGVNLEISSNIYYAKCLMMRSMKEIKRSSAENNNSGPDMKKWKEKRSNVTTVGHILAMSLMIVPIQREKGIASILHPCNLKVGSVLISCIWLLTKQWEEMM